MQRKSVLSIMSGWLVLVAFLLCSACGNRTSAIALQHAPFKISVMLPTYANHPLPDDTSPVLEKLEEYTNSDVELVWVPYSTYKDKTKITLSSLKLPTVIVIPDKSPEFISAARRGVFWELGPYLAEFPNLSQANEAVLSNTSIDGKVYAIYRARDLGRYGVTIRKDWLQHVGLEQPRTLDEFYEVLRAFTFDDPDRDGREDTYGLVATYYPSTFDVIQTWFGAPNRWGVDETGNLVPAHLTKEYKDGLRFLKKLYDEGLMNPGFAVMDPKFWLEPLIHGEAGVLVDVADQAQRAAHEIRKAYGLEDVIDVFSGVEGPQGMKLPSTSGYDGMLAVSKSAVKNEQELRHVLSFLDKLNDEQMQILLYNGMEGRHYRKSPESMKTDFSYEIDSLKQMLMFIPGPRHLISADSPIRRKVKEVIKANESLLLNNPAEEFISDTYMKKGLLLDTIVSDARTQYIIGQIDEKGWEEAVRRWRQEGGDEYIREMNEQWQRARSPSTGTE
ncbi:extracellular solute-binding protein [Paenibacillus sp.]|uniref:extracellular solute-binding protein n=1 Tax=Paenibacillus sp. TaxID=58172 RepID=UPI002D2A0E34|nr:extracellular solute-binding protein [Paenibacillus sp.]HZG83998.1 extracellular solute-binding protein [Paenibacillus sp.]